MAKKTGEGGEEEGEAAGREDEKEMTERWKKKTKPSGAVWEKGLSEIRGSGKRRRRHARWQRRGEREVAVSEERR